jgi:hypothetical protein
MLDDPVADRILRLLHSAGSSTTPRDRPISRRPVNMNAMEAAVIPWSFATALAIGIDPAVVVHMGGYRGKSEGLRGPWSR